jgi:hypothetical protein
MTSIFQDIKSKLGKLKYMNWFKYRNNRRVANNHISTTASTIDNKVKSSAEGQMPSGQNIEEYNSNKDCAYGDSNYSDTTETDTTDTDTDTDTDKDRDTETGANMKMVLKQEHSHNKYTINYFQLPLDIHNTDNTIARLNRELIIRKINIEQVQLDEVFENELRNCCETNKYITEQNHDIFKTKMRLLYVIIANNMHESLFDKKKKYFTNCSNFHLGVYHYENFIIRIDDSPVSFYSEKRVMNKGPYSNFNIIIPFFTYINKEPKKKTEDENKTPNSNVSENRSLSADTRSDITHTCNTYSEHLVQIYKTHNISFSVQPYIAQSDTLYDWVRENITYNQFISIYDIRDRFVIILFFKCVCLIEQLHLKNIVHGDIKPDNILIKKSADFNMYSNYKTFEIFLIDYGLSGTNEVSVGTGGTTPYCHPEFCNNYDYDNNDKYKWLTMKKHHDVWSLGIMFITLYTYGKFNYYYYKFPSYFFNSRGYVTDIVIDLIPNSRIKSIFQDILQPISISITDVKERLRNIIENM